MEWEALVEEHQKMVYRIAYSVLREHHDAEDAAQEAFLKVFRSAEKLAVVADPKAWVARIAWNAALDGRRGRRPQQVSVEELAQGVNELRAAGQSPEQIAAGQQMQGLLEQLMRGLPEKLRQVLALSTVEELSHAEVAAALGTSEAAVRARLFQARRQLREKLDRVMGVPV